MVPAGLSLAISSLPEGCRAVGRNSRCSGTSDDPFRREAEAAVDDMARSTPVTKLVQPPPPRSADGYDAKAVRADVPLPLTA